MLLIIFFYESNLMLQCMPFFMAQTIAHIFFIYDKRKNFYFRQTDNTIFHHPLLERVTAFFAPRGKGDIIGNFLASLLP